MAVAVSGYLAEGAATDVDVPAPSPVSASSQTTNKGGGGSVSPSSLDTKHTSARKARQRSKRMYQRVMSGLQKRGEVRLLTLTSASVACNQAFQRHFRQLRMRLLRRGLLVDYIRCPEFTKSGLRHEHILFRGSYIDQLYLSHLWAEIHGAPVVDIRRVSGRRRLAGYMANYMAKSPAGRYGYSWGWVWRGFAHSWTVLKRVSRDLGWNYKQLLIYWQWCVKLNIKPEDKLREVGYVFSYL